MLVNISLSVKSLIEIAIQKSDIREILLGQQKEEHWTLFSNVAKME
jgi:hypothetical protein